MERESDRCKTVTAVRGRFEKAGSAGARGVGRAGGLLLDSAAEAHLRWMQLATRARDCSVSWLRGPETCDRAAGSACERVAAAGGESARRMAAGSWARTSVAPPPSCEARGEGGGGDGVMRRCPEGRGGDTSARRMAVVLDARETVASPPPASRTGGEGQSAGGQGRSTGVSG